MSCIFRFDLNIILPSSQICFLDSVKLPTERPKSVREPLTMALQGELSLLSDVQSCLHCTVYTSGCLQAVDSVRTCASADLISELWRLLLESEVLQLIQEAACPCGCLFWWSSLPAPQGPWPPMTSLTMMARPSLVGASMSLAGNFCRICEAAARS